MPSFTLLSYSEEYALDVEVKPLPATRVVPAMVWSQAANGEWSCTDRGADQDYYEADMTFFGTKSDMDSLAAFLQSWCRGIFKIHNIDGFLFMPNVLQTGTLTCVIPSRDRVQQVYYSPTETGVQELKATFRAISATLINSPAASLSGLVLQEQFEADKTTAETTVFAYDQTATVLDRANDAGTFKGHFLQELASAQAILRYLLETARGSAFAFPTLPGVEFPFGEARGALPKSCKSIGLSCTQVDLTHWDIAPVWVESFA